MRNEASVPAIGRRAHIDSTRKSKAVKKGMRRRACDRGKLSGGRGRPRTDGVGRIWRSGSSKSRRRSRSSTDNRTGRSSCGGSQAGPGRHPNPCLSAYR